MKAVAQNTDLQRLRPFLFLLNVIYLANKITSTLSTTSTKLKINLISMYFILIQSSTNFYKMKFLIESSTNFNGFYTLMQKMIFQTFGNQHCRNLKSCRSCRSVKYALSKQNEKQYLQQ